MKITFVHAPEDFYDQNYGTQFLPVWAYCLASFVPKKWDIEIIDCRLEDITDSGPAEVFAFGGINQDFTLNVSGNNTWEDYLVEFDSGLIQNEQLNYLIL